VGNNTNIIRVTDTIQIKTKLQHPEKKSHNVSREAVWWLLHRCVLCVRAMERVMKDEVEFGSLTQFDPKGDLPFSFTSLCLSSYISQHF